MSMHHVITQAFRGSRKLQVLKPHLLQNRCVTAAASSKEMLDDSALANAKPFEEIPSMTIVPFIGTGWAFLPIIGNHLPFLFYRKYSKNKSCNLIWFYLCTVMEKKKTLPIKSAKN